MRKTFAGFKLTYTPGSLFRGVRSKLELQAPVGERDVLDKLIQLFDGHVGVGGGLVDLSVSKFYVLANPGHSEGLEVILRPRYYEAIIMWETREGVEIEAYGGARERFAQLFP